MNSVPIFETMLASDRHLVCRRVKAQGEPRLLFELQGNHGQPVTAFQVIVSEGACPPPTDHFKEAVADALAGLGGVWDA